MAKERKNFIKVKALRQGLIPIGTMTAAAAKEAVEYALLAAVRVAEICNTTEPYADYKTVSIDLKDMTEVKNTARYWNLTGCNQIDSYYIAATPLTDNNERGCYNVAPTMDELVTRFTGTINALKARGLSSNALADATLIYEVPVQDLPTAVRIALVKDASKGKIYEVCTEEQNIDDMPFDTLLNICNKYGKEQN